MNTQPSVKSLSRAVLLLFLIQSLSSQAAPTSTIQSNDLDWVDPQEELASADDNDTPSNENGDIIIMYPPPNFLERSTSHKLSLEEFKSIFEGLPVTIVDAETLRPKRSANRFGTPFRHINPNWQGTDLIFGQRRYSSWGGKRVTIPAPTTEPTKIEETTQNEEDEPMNFKSELERINYKLANKDFEKVMKQMPDECVGDVKSGRYNSAIQKLLILGDSEIDYIVKTLYNNKQSNFDVVIKFAQNVPSNDKAFLIYKALYNEVKPIDEQTVNGRLTKFIKINENLNKQLISAERVTESARTKARALFDILNETIEPMAIEIISDAFLSARGLSQDTVCRLKQDLRNVSFNYMKSILDKSMDYAWKVMSRADRRLNAERFMNELSTLYKDQSCN